MSKIAYLILALALISCLWACEEKKPETSCLYGENIPPEDLESIELASNHMLDLLLRGDLRPLYDEASRGMKTFQNPDQFAFAVNLYQQAFGKIDYPHLDELYLLDSKYKNGQMVWIECNLGSPGVSDAYQMPANQRIAVAVYNARTELELCRIVFQLIEEDGKWRLQSLTLNPTTIKKKTDKFYLEKAVKYRETNRRHLAVLYLKAARLLHDMGPNVNEFTVNSIMQEIAKIKVDYMPQGGGDFQVWATDSGSYKVYNLDINYNQGNLLVDLSYVTDSLRDKDKLEKEAWDLARFLDKKFPEYRLGFDGIRVTAAPEAPEELMTAYHTIIMYDELGASPVVRDNAPGNKESGKKAPGKETPDKGAAGEKNEP